MVTLTHETFKRLTLIFLLCVRESLPENGPNIFYRNKSKKYDLLIPKQIWIVVINIVYHHSLSVQHFMFQSYYGKLELFFIICLYMSEVFPYICF